jgi:cell wall-associated NlpC family hydrolase
MARSGGVSGLAVGLAAGGGLLVWSAIRNVNPFDTLKEVLGRPATPTPISTPFSDSTSGVRSVTAVAAVGTAGVAGSSPQAARLVEECRKLIGTPYVWASASASGVDCSGMVVLALKRMGVDAPRFTTATFGTWAQSMGAKRVGPDDFRAGDVIVRTGHMGVAISGTRLIHAPTVGKRVQEAEIWNRSNWWGWRMFGTFTAAKK